MFNCIKADALRVLKKKGFLITMSIVILLIIGAAILTVFFPGEDRGQTFADLAGVIYGINGLLVGIPIFLAVFSDDFKSKAMQTAIGFGISRPALIICRVIEMVWLIIQTGIVFSIVSVITGVALGASTSVLLSMIGNLWYESLKIILYGAVSMIIVYLMQSATTALVIFILSTVGTIDLVLMGIGAIPAVQKLHLDPTVITIESVLSKAMDKTYALAPLMWVVAILAFLVLPTIITIVVFQKKELEF